MPVSCKAERALRESQGNATARARSHYHNRSPGTYCTGVMVANDRLIVLYRSRRSCYFPRKIRLSVPLTLLKGFAVNMFTYRAGVICS